MKVKELLTDESKWTQKACARDINGRWTNPFWSNAVKWCLDGATMKCYSNESAKYFMDHNLNYKQIIKKIQDKLGVDNYSIWNDQNERTFEEIKSLVEELDI